MREGFLVVALTWLLAAGFGSIPYLFEGGSQLSHPVDAYFEGMSGFTTTGASVVTDFDEINRSLGMWRQFTQWLGGMGIIVLAIAVLPRLRIGGRRLMESELPGPEIAALSERIRSTARRLWFLYVALTVLQTLMLSSLWLFGIDELMTPYRGPRAFVLHDADGRLLDAAALCRGIFSGVAVDPRALHVDRRSQLRAHVSRDRSASSTRDSPATRSFGCTSHSPWLRRPR